jgi:two-component system sensor histidine kinase KdpD
VAATRWGRGPSLLAAILSVAAFDLFFVPPHMSFAVADTQYVVTFVVMAIVAVVISELTARVKEQAEISRERERRTAALYSLSRELASTRNLDVMIAAVRRLVEEVFEGEVAIFPRGRRNAGVRTGGPPRGGSEGEGGRSVGTRAPARGPRHEHPLSGPRLSIFRSSEAAAPSESSPSASIPSAVLGTEQMHLLETFANQAALALERAPAREAHRQRLAAESEKLRTRSWQPSRTI